MKKENGTSINTTNQAPCQVEIVAEISEVYVSIFVGGKYIGNMAKERAIIKAEDRGRYKITVYHPHAYEPSYFHVDKVLTYKHDDLEDKLQEDLTEAKILKKELKEARDGG